MKDEHDEYVDVGCILDSLFRETGYVQYFDLLQNRRLSRLSRPWERQQLKFL